MLLLLTVSLTNFANVNDPLWHSGQKRGCRGKAFNILKDTLLGVRVGCTIEGAL